MKPHKLDLEACFTVGRGRDERLVGLGSGSTPARCCAVVLSRRTGRARVVPLPRLYDALAAHPAFTTSELNLEGAVVLGDVVRLYQRSNGRPHAPAERPSASGRAPSARGTPERTASASAPGPRGRDARRDASCDLSLPDFLALLAAPARAPLPALRRVCHYTLGALDGVRLTVTDAARSPHDGRVWFVAAAEASPDAYRDGEVTGSVLGVFDDATRRALWTPVCDARGVPQRLKAEGLALCPDDPTLAWVVIDPDSEHEGTSLLRVRLQGPGLRPARARRR